jgi:hypothetical protein
MAHALAKFNDGSANRDVSQMHYNDGSFVRDIMVGTFNNGAGDQEVFRKVWHRSDMTKGTVSGGTTTITSSRGYSNGTYAVSAIGTKTNKFSGEECALFCRRLAAGADPLPSTTFYLPGAWTQISGPQTNVRISIDGGANWTTLTWSSSHPDWGHAGYYIAGDPFGFSGMSNGQAFETIVQYEP